MSGGQGATVYMGVRRDSGALHRTQCGALPKQVCLRKSLFELNA